MITLNASGSSVTFTFDGNSTYLNDGTITVPKNSLALIADESDMITFRKSASNDIFVSANIAEFGMTKDELIAWYKANMVSSGGGGGGGVTPSEVQTMIDESISGKADSSAVTEEISAAVSGYADAVAYDSNTKAVKFYHGGTGGTEVYNFDASPFLIDGMVQNVEIKSVEISGVATTCLVISFNTDAGKQDINIPISQIFDANNYYTTAQTDSAISAAISGKADTSYVDSAVSGKVDTNTYTAYTAATNSVLSGKQDTLSAGTGISIVDNVISATGGGGGECTVEETVVYERLTQTYNDYEGDNKLTYVIVDYLGDKTTAESIEIHFQIGDTSDAYHGWVYFDYVNHSANTDSDISGYVTVEYIDNIQDFKVSVASAYQSTYWIKSIESLDDYKNALMPFYTINSGSPCTVITTDVVGLVEKVKNKAYTALSDCSFQSSGNEIYLDVHRINGGAGRSTIKLEDLNGSANKLKTNIQVGLGVSGWTEITFNGSCGTNGNPKSPIIRFSGDTNSLDAFNTQWEVILEHYGSTYDTVRWDGERSEFVLDSNWFGENGQYGTATVTYDDTNNTLTIAYPLTAQVYDYTDNVELNNIYNQNCQFGTTITKLEYYGEFTQPLKPYVQQLRSDVNTISGQVATKQDTLSAGTGISIVDNVISATGGGEVSSAITSGDTNAVAGGAVFDAVVYSANTYTTELTFDANGYAENWVVGQSAITIDVSGYTSNTSANYIFEDGNGIDLGNADIHKMIGSWGSQWNNNASNCTITTDGNTATTATITDIPSGTVNIKRSSASNPPKAIISGDTPEIWIKDALDDHRDNTTVHITAAERTYWNNKSNFSGSYNDLTDKPIPDSALTSNSTNAVQNQALYSELRIDNGGGETETTLTFEGGSSTNYPSGCTKLKVEVVGSNNGSNIGFFNGWSDLGNIKINNWGSISVSSSFQGATYEISGTTVIISYPTVTNVTKISVSSNGNYVYKAVTTEPPTVLKDQVVANTTALNGKVDTNTYTAYTAATDSRLAEDEEVTAAALVNLNETFTAHTSDTTVHVTSAQTTTWNNKANVWCGDETAWGQISGGTLDSNTLYLVY